MYLGQIFENEELGGTVYYIVTEVGSQTKFEKLEDFIIRNYVVQTGDVYRTIRDIIEDEKRYIIRRGKVDAQNY